MPFHPADRPRGVRDHVSPARIIAAEVLARVWDGKAFAAAALDAELQNARHHARTTSLEAPGFDTRDAALATEFVYGVLRTEAFLDDRVAAIARRKGYAKNAIMRAHLLIAAYSIAFLDRIPAFAAVSEAVVGVRATADEERAAGFANAVLRRFASDIEASGRPDLTQAIVDSAPGWLRGGLRRSLGRAGASAFLAAGPVPPPIGIALATGEDRAGWIDKLREAAPGASIEPGSVSPRAILIRGAGDVRKLPGALQAWIIQEEGAQAVALAASVHPGDVVLDACAGRGNKTWILGQEVGSKGAVDASDLYPAKLAKLREGPRGQLVRGTFVVDWTATAPSTVGQYDRVVVDAPCSGVGTLRRRPEIVHGHEADDLSRLSELQTTIARGAAAHVRDGGRLFFAVCSVLREEAEDVVARLVAPPIDETGPRIEPAPFDDEVARRLAGEGNGLRLLPHVHGTDGYFVASFIVRKG